MVRALQEAVTLQSACKMPATRLSSTRGPTYFVLTTMRLGEGTVLHPKPVYEKETEVLTGVKCPTELNQPGNMLTLSRSCCVIPDK